MLSPLDVRIVQPLDALVAAQIRGKAQRAGIVTPSGPGAQIKFGACASTVELTTSQPAVNLAGVMRSSDGSTHEWR
jgi:hypothetical protein